MNLDSNFSDFEAEEKFVSAIISAPDELIELQPNATYFELGVCRNFVQTALDFVKDGVNYALDTTIFYDILGINEVMRFSSDTVPSFHAKYYLERVKEAYRKRQIAELSKHLITAATNGDDNEKILTRAKNFLSETEKRSDSTRREIKTFDVAYLLDTEFPEPEWIVRDMIPEGLAFLAGKPKAGKSWLSMQLANAVGSGGEWLGRKVDKRKVLYLALEDSPRRLSERAKIQGWGRDSSVRLATFDEFGIIGRLDETGVSHILSQMERYGYGLVIIDTLTRAVDSDQFDPREMRRILSPLQNGVLALNACAVVIDHMPKLSGGEENVINDVYGSISKVGIADTIIGFYRDPHSDTGKIAGTGRDFEEFSLSVKYDKPHGSWFLIDDHVRARYTEQRHEVLEYVAGALDVAVTHVAVELGINKGTASKVLKDLANDGLLLAYSQGRKIYYQTTQAGTETLKRWGDEITTGNEILNAVEDK